MTGMLTTAVTSRRATHLAAGENTTERASVDNITATGIPVSLLWLPYICIVGVLLTLLVISFCTYHRQHSHKYFRRSNGSSNGGSSCDIELPNPPLGSNMYLRKNRGQGQETDSDDEFYELAASYPSGPSTSADVSMFTTSCGGGGGGAGPSAWYHSCVGMSGSASAYEDLLLHAPRVDDSPELELRFDHQQQGFDAYATDARTSSMINVCMLDMEGVFTSGFSSAWDIGSYDSLAPSSDTRSATVERQAHSEARHQTTTLTSSMNDKGYHSNRNGDARGLKKTSTASNKPIQGQGRLVGKGGDKGKAYQNVVSRSRSRDRVMMGDGDNRQTNAAKVKTVARASKGKVTDRPRPSGRGGTTDHASYDLQRLDVHALNSNRQQGQGRLAGLPVTAL